MLQIAECHNSESQMILIVLSKVGTLLISEAVTITCQLQLLIFILAKNDKKSLSNPFNPACNLVGIEYLCILRPKGNNES